MKPEGPLPRIQKPITCPYPEPDQSSPYPPSHFSKINCSIILASTSESSEQSPSLGFPTKTLCASLVSPIHATCSAHLFLFYLITRVIFDEGSSSLPSYLIPLRPKYPPQRPILENNRQNYISLG